MNLIHLKLVKYLTGDAMDMKKLKTLEPGRLEEIVVIVFFVLFFILTALAESTAQVNNNQVIRDFSTHAKNISK